MAHINCVIIILLCFIKCTNTQQMITNCVNTSSTPLSVLLCYQAYFYAANSINEVLWQQLLPTAQQNAAFTQVFLFNYLFIYL
jgi:hypothetical protein